MAIEVTLEDHNGNTSRAAKLAETAPIAQLLPAVVSALGLPVLDSAGRPVVYHMSHNGQQLQDADTLESVGVAVGDTITIVPVMTAGAASARPGEMLQLGEVLRAYRPVPGLPRSAPRKPAALQVRVSRDAMAAVWDQAHAAPEHEVGGLLLGTVYEERGQLLVAVEEAVEARHTRATLGSLTFTVETWLDLLPRRRAEAAVVGWYHSHPGHGIFLSAHDLDVHRNFFSDAAWYLALVVDPLREEWGVFGWDKGEIVRCVEAAVQ